MKILFCTSEMYPFVKTGGLGDVCGALPAALLTLGVDVSVAMPLYGCIDQMGYHELIESCEDYDRVRTVDGVEVFLVKHEKYFGSRQGVYGENKKDYSDNLARFAFFSRKICQLIDHNQIKCDMIHTHDWTVAILPVYIKSGLLKQKSIPVVLSIHNLAFQGVFPKDQYETLDLPKKYYDVDGFEFYDQISFLKAGILFSDRVLTVSPQYAQDILTKEFGCGLESVLRAKKPAVVGILNGLDETVWTSSHDHYLTHHFNQHSIEKIKPLIKKQLFDRFEKFDDLTSPVYAYVGRITHQKGFDLIIQQIEAILDQGAKVVVLGMGDSSYEASLTEWSQARPSQLAAVFRFDESLAHLIYAGSDFFLIPSVFEPCGLSQMISMAYGTIPLGFKTGGLSDTIVDGENGFLFSDYTEDAFMDMFLKSFDVFRNPQQIKAMRLAAYLSDFKWQKSAEQYIQVYKECF